MALMNTEPASKNILPDGGRSAFLGTRWSIIIRTRDRNSKEAEMALSELCRIYWYPLYAFVRRCGHSHHEAEDLTQGFFLHLIGKDGIRNVDPAKGKFRSFLLSSIKHFLSNEREHSQALKRGGKQTLLSIDLSDGERRYSVEPADTMTPQAMFENSWAMNLLADTMADLRREYESRQRKDVFDLVEGFIVESGPVVSYATAAATLGTSEGNIKVLVYRIRRRFGELLRERIAHTVESDAEIDDEIRHLMSCFTTR